VDQGAEQPVVGAALRRELGVPLDPEREGMVLTLDGLDQALVVVGAHAPGGWHGGDGLVMAGHHVQPF
jgi:hypothetical protein